ncbi:Uncharacterised protein [Sporosarcina pasteurii]|uniref:Uncharacterized protein n=1 Tax=Sporosarcina pasteurii TaxID=1474 RepID=A0A380BMF8_SPOPA|nr:Uncharacterised protein [Sporosarcina pasteurii]
MDGIMFAMMSGVFIFAIAVSAVILREVNEE